ncbi:hypothetical protein T265_00508 [Opisthorchis viverrini]|uniref:Uncharacterized protein n=1 Tax=Opisthorchis viverrini TaxID=6198 RepID=A0A075A1M0_OPIVI|nr:hypothetical protein T265_00508 [Opisthorchis viverrini]KER33618.1 hypothetical protein T265_00508 [Opisthorchis viverrini]
MSDVLERKLLTRLLKTLRQPTTSFALLFRAHQVGVVPEFTSTLCSAWTQIGLIATNTFICKSTWFSRVTQVNPYFMLFFN